MFTYPIRVVAVSSRVTKRRKIPYQYLREAADKIEKSVNGIFEKDNQLPIMSLTYEDISRDSGVRLDLVKDFLKPIGGGSGGITVKKDTLNP